VEATSKCSMLDSTLKELLMRDSMALNSEALW